MLTVQPRLITFSFELTLMAGFAKYAIANDTAAGVTPGFFLGDATKAIYFWLPAGAAAILCRVCARPANQLGTLFCTLMLTYRLFAARAGHHRLFC
jgi:hypothetical protein